MNEAGQIVVSIFAFGGKCHANEWNGWAVRDKSGRLGGFEMTRLQVEKALVGTAYDDDALANDPRYRALFNGELDRVLETDGLTVVPAKMTLTEIEQ